MMMIMMMSMMMMIMIRHIKVEEFRKKNSNDLKDPVVRMKRRERGVTTSAKEEKSSHT